MEALVINGGRPLRGTVEISGAKNAALPILAATVGQGGRYVLRNCPDITDVTLAGEIIRTLGGTVERTGKTLHVDTEGVCRWSIPQPLMAKMRASVLFLGALLARFGRAELTLPGGCPLGRRPIDLHLEAMAQMGACITLQEDVIWCSTQQLRGCEIDLELPSVGATENILLAAVACQGTVILRNAAREPEIGDLIGFLRTMGADIRGAGTGTLTIKGGEPLCGATYTVLPDRIETATYLCAAAATGGDVTLRSMDAKLQEPVTEILTRAGCRLTGGRDSLRISGPERLRAVGEIQTAPYPGFPTDCQAIMMAALLRSKGENRFTETIFDNRFGHVPQFRTLGADIALNGPTAVVRGVASLRGGSVEGCDLRCTAALLLSALQAEGETQITGLKHLRRGYDNMEAKLKALGAVIEELTIEN